MVSLVRLSLFAPWALIVGAVATSEKAPLSYGGDHTSKISRASDVHRVDEARSILPLPSSNNVRSLSIEEDKRENGNENDVQDSSAVNIELPETLNSQTFKDVTSEKITFVEFFSPYCSHCKTLAPKWEETFKTYYSEMEKMGIQMRQVNCVESGDLCEKEDIYAYPMLRIYVPKVDPETGAKIAGQLKFVSSFPRTLVRTVENLKKFMQNAVAEYASGEVSLPSASKLVSEEDMLKIIAGDIDQAYFVTFFPAHDNDWVESDTSDTNKFPRGCEDCYDIKQMWGMLSNQVLSTVKTCHFNCLSNPALCKELGFEALVKGSGTPKFVAFVPKSAGKVRFDYHGKETIADLKKFISRLNDNYQYELVTTRGLSDIMEYRLGLPTEPLNSYFPLNNEVAVVYYFDPNTDNQEDRAILPHLLDIVTNLPTNVHIYTAKSTKFEKDVLKQAENTVKFVNSGLKDRQYEFNKNMLFLETLTRKPTLIVFRENSLLTDFYQNLTPEDIRDHEKIDEFIKKNQFPLYGELNYGLLKHYFDVEESDDTDSKVVVTFIDAMKAGHTSLSLYNISLTAHEHSILRNDYLFNYWTKNGQLRQEDVEKLQSGKSTGTEIISEMKKQVPHDFNRNQVHFTYINLAEFPTMANDIGLSIDGHIYEPGDTIIVDRNARFYWDTDITGKRLKNDPDMLKDTLKCFLDQSFGNEEVSSKNVHLNAKLVGSPYGESLRFMDFVHQRGVSGYSLVIIAVVLLSLGMRRVIRRGKLKLGSSSLTTSSVTAKRD